MNPGRRRWPFVLLVVTCVIAAGAGLALSRLDAFLLAQARSRADALGAQLGRSVTIGSLTTTLIGGAGLRVEKLEVGPGPGELESDTLATLGRAEVKVPLWPVLLSRGKDVPLKTVELQDLVVTVVRHRDGVTNLEGLVERLKTQPPSTPAPVSAGAPVNLSGVQVDHAELTGEIRFVDRSGAAPRELAIKQLRLELGALRVGQRAEATLKAAVLAPSANLVAKLSTAPLPRSLTPTPERLSVTLKPVDLTPLAPFLPSSVGLRAGSLAADFWAQLGAAVPGGSGPTRLVGTVHGKGLQLVEAEGGKALDATLEADVTGDVEQGDLKLDRLHLALGPAELNGVGEVKGLLTSQPSVRGLEISSKDLDPALLAAYYPKLRERVRGAGGPLGLLVKASGDSGAQAILVRLDFTPMHLSFPGQLTKAAGAAMVFEGTVSGAAMGGGALQMNGKLDLRGADLRPGGQLNKPPGLPCDVALKALYQPARGSSDWKLEVPAATLRVRGDTLSGSGRVDVSGRGAAHKMSFSLSLSSAHLDADALVLPEAAASSPPAPGVVPGTVPAGATSGRTPAPHPGAAPVDHTFEGLSGVVQAQIAAVRYKQTDFRKVSVDAKLEGDQVSLSRFSADVTGGSVTLEGTQVRLGPPDHPFTLRAKASGLSMAALLPRNVPADLVTGTFNGEVSVKGSWGDRATLSRTLTGRIEGDLLEGTFRGADLVAKVVGPLMKALPLSAKELQAANATSLGKTLPFALELANGVARLKKPLQVTQEKGSLKIDGGIALDGKLDLAGVLAVSPEVLSQLTRGKVTLAAPLPIGFRVEGPVTSPTVTALDLGAAVREILRQAATQGLGKLLGGKLSEKLKALDPGAAGGPAGSTDAPQGSEEAAKKAVDEAKSRLEQKAREQLKSLLGN